MFGDDVFDTESAAIFDAAYDSTACRQDKKLLSMTPHLIRPFFLRRLKSQVETSLPPKEEIIVKLAMSRDQRRYYKSFLMAHSALLDEVSASFGDKDKKRARGLVTEWKKLRALYMNLRKIALHPFLLENLWPRVTVKNCPEVIAHSSKLQVLDQLLVRLKKGGHRVLLFSCFTMVLDLLVIYCRFRKWRFLRLDGSTSRIRRKIDIQRFNDDPNSPFFLYLISNRAGGLGINLQSADTVIHFDTDWNPQSDLQAQARAHRIGQKKMVKIYRLISKDTVEERILFRSQQKLYLDAVVMTTAKMMQDAEDKDDGTDAEPLDLDDHDLLKCIKFGAHKMMESGDAENDDIDLDLLLERSYKVSGVGDGDGDINGAESMEKEKASRQKLLRDLSAENNVADFDFSKPLVAGNVFEGRVYEKKQFVAGTLDDVECTGSRRAAHKRTRTETVDGMQFQVAVEEDPQLGFYQNCGRQIYDFSKRTASLWHHESTRCWGCDGHFDADSERIECSKCPKTFHHDDQCWRGYDGGFGAPQCSQHRCYECGLKTSECGLILRCLGCPMSYCLECAPAPHWKSENGDGLHFVDECAVTQHHGFSLPESSYMFIWCGSQCRTWYLDVYSERDLPDLSATVDELDHEMVRRLRADRDGEREGDSVSSSESKSKSKSKRNKKKKVELQRAQRRSLSEISVEWRVRSRFMANGLMDRLKENMDGNWPIIDALYDALYSFDVDGSVHDDDEDDANDDGLGMDNAPDPAASILGADYLAIRRVRECADRELTAPQWIQCVDCKQWRVIPVGIGRIGGGRWLKEQRYAEWRCSIEDGLDRLCDSKQPAPSKRTHSEQEVAVLRLQRKWMNARCSKEIDLEIKAQLEALKSQKAHKLTAVGDAEMAEARFIGIGRWNGFHLDADPEADEQPMCRFYGHLVAAFREWRMESIKTLMDHFGFFVEQKTKDKATGTLKVAQIALSHPKDLVVHRLCRFLMFPTESALHLKTADLKR